MHRDLVERAMAGDHEAFGELARLSIGRLYAAAHLILRDQGQAEDATQEALVAAWRDLSALRDPDRFDAWLRTLLVRACYREARRGRRTRIAATVPSIPSIQPAVPDRSADIADRDEVERGFRRLDPDQRAVIVMHFYLGLPLVEVAATLGIPEGTAKSRLHRATQAMRATLDADARDARIAEGGLA
jgi:RNA polymerase sigma-70 factor (ECF subfamily)